MASYFLSIDQGTTSTRAIVFGEKGEVITQCQKEFKQYFPSDGWVEHSPADLWQTTLTTCRNALSQLESDKSFVQAIGITNQRETTLIWDRRTGEPIYPAIVWQDRRTSDACLMFKNLGLETKFIEKTGLLLDPYFSGTKIAWILDQVEGARSKAEAGQLAFGTVDTWLLWNLTAGKEHKTDATNASRTLLFNIHTQDWDDELLEILNIPKSILPEVSDCAAEFGVSDKELFGMALPIRAIAGDQHAALIGQCCFSPGMVKSTYGTGCFLMLNTGKQALTSNNKLLTTIAYRIKGETSYAVEGSIFIAGAAVQWLRDGIKLITHAQETSDWAVKSDPNQAVFFVPAFIGLGAPYWDPDARGAILGLTRDTGIAEIVRAALESVAFQTRDLTMAMQADGAESLRSIRVDGGMVNNDWVCQRLADLLGTDVERPHVTETTALGVAMLAAYQSGCYTSLEELSANWSSEYTFRSSMSVKQRDDRYKQWQAAVRRIRTNG